MVLRADGHCEGASGGEGGCRCLLLLGGCVQQGVLEHLFGCGASSGVVGHQALCVRACVRVCACVCVRCLCVCVYVCVCLCAKNHTHIYIYIYIHIHTSAHTQTHTQHSYRSQWTSQHNPYPLLKRKRGSTAHIQKTGLARAIYMQSMYGIFGREITKYTVYGYGV